MSFTFCAQHVLYIQLFIDFSVTLLTIQGYILDITKSNANCHVP